MDALSRPLLTVGNCGKVLERRVVWGCRNYFFVSLHLCWVESVRPKVSPRQARVKL